MTTGGIFVFAEKESHLQEWRTDGVRCHEQFSYWHDAVCEKILSVKLSRRGDGSFNGMLQAYPMGPFAINHVRSEEHIADLTKEGISRLKSHYYKLHIQKTSIAKVCQNGCETILKPGDAILIDSLSPFRLDFPTYFECYSVKIPRERLRPLLKDPRAATSMPILGTSPLSKAIKHYIQFLISIAEESLGDDQLELYFDSLLGLIAVATSASLECKEVNHLSQLEKKISRIKEYILDNLEDPDLTPAKVANHFSISASYLHKLFAKEGQTFGSFLREQRLDYAAVYLQNQLGNGRTISELAYRLGFNDLSYFWRLFRKRFGMTPRTYRSDFQMTRTNG
jgi:AraC-like DNA-binding protein